MIKHQPPPLRAGPNGYVSSTQDVITAIIIIALVLSVFILPLIALTLS